MGANQGFKLGKTAARLMFAGFLCASGILLAVSSFTGVGSRFNERENGEREERERYGVVPTSELEELDDMELDWHNRLTYPTGRFDPAWVREAAAQDARIARGMPAGTQLRNPGDTSQGLDPNGFTALGPQPLKMSGCSGCFSYGLTEGRVNDIAVDPTTTTNGSIVAYLGSVGGGVWKTTNCCSSTTTWSPVTDDPAPRHHQHQLGEA